MERGDIADKENIELKLGESGFLRIPLRLAEKHLTEDVVEAKADIQAIGYNLQILVRSERRDMLLRMPICEWTTTKVYKRSMTGWTINLKRWNDIIQRDAEEKVPVELLAKDNI